MVLYACGALLVKVTIVLKLAYTSFVHPRPSPAFYSIKINKFDADKDNYSTVLTNLPLQESNFLRAADDKLLQLAFLLL
jgi:hypothetical protein